MFQKLLLFIILTKKVDSV